MLFDVNTGEVLWQKDPGQPLPIASLTKMMTALVVAGHTHPSDRVLITSDALHYTGSGVGLLPKNKRVSLTALLYGLLLPSGNDAAIALADHVARTQSRFIALMNQRAQALGLRCTHFTTVSGIVDQGNYSCAQDLALIAHLVLEQPLLAGIVGSRSRDPALPDQGRKALSLQQQPAAGAPLSRHRRGQDRLHRRGRAVPGRHRPPAAGTWLGVVLLHAGDTSTEAQQLLSAGFAKLRQS